MHKTFTIKKVNYKKSNSTLDWRISYSIKSYQYSSFKVIHNTEVFLESECGEKCCLVFYYNI